jgi:hypothetical protein
MAMFICRLRAEERRTKVRIGCIRDKKVLRKDLVTVSNRGHPGSGLKEAPVQDDILSARDNRTLLFSENGDTISMNKNNKETCGMVWQFCLSYA